MLMKYVLHASVLSDLKNDSSYDLNGENILKNRSPGTENQKCKVCVNQQD